MDFMHAETAFRAGAGTPHRNCEHAITKRESRDVPCDLRSMDA